MSKSAGSIFVDLLLRNANYEEGLKKSRKSTSDFEKGIKNLARELAPFIGGAAFAAIANNALNAADKISKLSQQLGLTAEQYQKYAYAAQLGGVDTERFATAIGFLNNQIAEGKLPYADTSSALLDISDKMKNAKDGIDRARIASEAFGAKAGRAMIPVLIQGSENVRELGREAEKLGIIFSTQLAKDTETFKDQIEILGTVFTNNFQISLLEEFVSRSGELRDIYTDPEFIDSARTLGKIFGAMASAMIDVAKNLGAISRAFGESFVRIGGMIGLIDDDIVAEAAKEAESIRAGGGTIDLSPSTPDTADSGKPSGRTRITTEQKKTQDELNKLYEKNRDVILGLNRATITYMDSVEELNKLLKGKKITLEEYNEAVKRLDIELEKNKEKFNEWGIDVTEFGKQAAANIQDAFADFLFDPFEQGTKGMLKGFVDTVRRMIANAQAANLAKYLFGDLATGGTTGSSGALGGIFDSVLGSLGSSFGGFFADGGYLGAGQWGVAGEAGAELIYGGKTGVSVMNTKNGGDTYIDARGADMTAIRKLEQIIYERTSREAILGTVMQGQMRGAL